MLHIKNSVGRITALTCAATLVSGTALADVITLSSDINEYTLEPEDPCNDDNPNNDIYHNCPGAYLDGQTSPDTVYQQPAPEQTLYQPQEYVAPEVVETAPAPENVIPYQAPDPLAAQEVAPIDYVSPAPTAADAVAPYSATSPSVPPAPVPSPAPVSPPPTAVVAPSAPVPAGAVAAPTAPVAAGGTGFSSLSGAALGAIAAVTVAAGVGIAIAANSSDSSTPSTQ